MCHYSITINLFFKKTNKNETKFEVSINHVSSKQIINKNLNLVNESKNNFLLYIFIMIT